MAAFGGGSKVDMEWALAGVPWLVVRFAVILMPFELKVHSTQRAGSAAVVGSGPARHNESFIHELLGLWAV